jgi:hypothetical protein
MNEIAVLALMLAGMLGYVALIERVLRRPDSDLRAYHRAVAGRRKSKNRPAS